MKKFSRAAAAEDASFGYKGQTSMSYTIKDPIHPPDYIPYSEDFH